MSRLSLFLFPSCRHRSRGAIRSQRAQRPYVWYAEVHLLFLLLLHYTSFTQNLVSIPSQNRRRSPIIGKASREGGLMWSLWRVIFTVSFLYPSVRCRKTIQRWRQKAPHNRYRVNPTTDTYNSVFFSTCLCLSFLGITYRYLRLCALSSFVLSLLDPLFFSPSLFLFSSFTTQHSFLYLWDWYNAKLHKFQGERHLGDRHCYNHNSSRKFRYIYSYSFHRLFRWFSLLHFLPIKYGLYQFYVQELETDIIDFHKQFLGWK